MIKKPTALFAPGIIFGVLKQMITRKTNNNFKETLTNSTEVVSQ
jgi:hypothetical protein